MSKLILNRVLRLKDRIIGKLYVRNNKDEQAAEFYTLELPYEANKRNVSCIPTGTYKVIPWVSPKFHNCFKVLNVKDRTDILIHAGNYPRDTRGCILIGLDYNSDNHAIAYSRKALKQLRTWLMNDKEVELSIE